MACFDRHVDESGAWESIAFWCPGCQCLHSFRVKAPSGPVWTWNKDMEAPTFSPSLLVDRGGPETRCHLFLLNGRIRYLDDCHHELRGQQVDAPEIPV